MSAAFSPREVSAGLHDLFKFAYTTNCHLEDETLTEEEKQTLEDLDDLEVLENFKDLVMDLLEFKKEFRQTDQSELAKRSEQFEAMLQKLESEVRNHIRVEQQLKLHLEAAQARVDELEKKGDSSKLLSELATKEKEIEDLKARSPIRDLEQKLKLLEEKYKEEISRLTQQQRQSLHYRAGSLEREEKKHSRKGSDDRGTKLVEDRRQKAISRLESDCSRLKSALEDKTHELESVRRDFEKLSKELFIYRERAKNRDTEFQRVQTDKSPLSDREMQQRKSDLEALFKKRPEASPFKSAEKRDAGATYKQKLEFFQTFTGPDIGKQSKKHGRTGSDKANWRPASSSIRSRPASSLKE